jgi:hypothetical protein
MASMRAPVGHGKHTWPAGYLWCIPPSWASPPNSLDRDWAGCVGSKRWLCGSSACLYGGVADSYWGPAATLWRDHGKCVFPQGTSTLQTAGQPLQIAWWVGVWLWGGCCCVCSNMLGRGTLRAMCCGLLFSGCLLLQQPAPVGAQSRYWHTQVNRHCCLARHALKAWCLCHAGPGEVLCATPMLHCRCHWDRVAQPQLLLLLVVVVLLVHAPSGTHLWWSHDGARLWLWCCEMLSGTGMQVAAGCWPKLLPCMACRRLVRASWLCCMTGAAHAPAIPTDTGPFSTGVQAGGRAGLYTGQGVRWCIIWVWPSDTW